MAAPVSLVSGAEGTSIAHEDTRHVIDQHLEAGKALLERGEHVAAQAEFRKILTFDATHRQALRLITRAQRALKAQEAKVARADARLQKEAQKLATQFAREKLHARNRQQQRAQQQLAEAREHQIKLLYNRGLSLYGQGAYEQAVQVLQQLVLLNPSHALVGAAQQLIMRAETKQIEARVRAEVGPGTSMVPELERALAAKRIEIETVLKYAKHAKRDKDYDRALGLLHRVLTHDPSHREAQRLLNDVHEAKLTREAERLKQLVQQDERAMINEVLRAQLMPEMPPPKIVRPVAARTLSETVTEKLAEPISFRFESVPLSDVLQFLADAANISLIPSPQLNLRERLVTLNVREMPLGQAIKYLAKSQSLAYRIEQDVVLIATAEEFAREPMETQVFFLESGLGPFALEAAAISMNPTLRMDTFEQLIARTVPQPSGSTLVIDERNGALIATNTRGNLVLIEQLLEQLDVAPIQVLIEARFVEISMTALDELGLEVLLTSDAALTKKGSGDGTTSPGHQISDTSGFKFPALTRESEGLNLTFEGILTGTQFEAVLHALRETSKAKTLSAPRVTTLNNQTALIRVVEEFQYPTRYEVSLIQFDINGDGDFDDAGETEFANVPKDIQKRDIGILLAVTPSVGKDRTSITLIVAPEVSTFTKFRTLEGGVIVPEFTTSQLTTSVIIEDGQTIVLGGLMQDSTTDTVTKVPFFGDLPLVGALFRQHEEISTRKNLLIFITARVLAPRGETT